MVTFKRQTKQEVLSNITHEHKINALKKHIEKISDLQNDVFLDEKTKNREMSSLKEELNQIREKSKNLVDKRKDLIAKLGLLENKFE